MANQEHLDILKQGVKAWNRWKKKHKDIEADLSKADLRGVDLSKADLSKTNLRGANLEKTKLENVNFSKADLSRANLNHVNIHLATFRGAKLRRTKLQGTNFLAVDLGEADLSKASLNFAQMGLFTFLEGATLIEARLIGADLVGANFSGANLKQAKLFRADLSKADFSKANLSGADLSWTILNETNLEEADLSGCTIYGISSWNVKLEHAIQSGLVITDSNEPIITVDNLEVAQFIYLLLHNEKIRDVIDTITSKLVLILGRFTLERKTVLDAIREELRKRNYTPVLFDFEKPASRDITETISILAHMARFVIADLTDAKSIPQELQSIVPHLPSVPIQPLLLSSQREYGMFEHFPRYPWVLPIYHYHDVGELLHSLKEYIIDPAEQKAQELEKR